MAVPRARTITRLINLSFRVSGLREQAVLVSRIMGMIVAATAAMHALLNLYRMYQAQKWALAPEIAAVTTLIGALTAIGATAYTMWGTTGQTEQERYRAGSP